MIPVVGALIFDGGRLLAAKRPEGMHLAGRWEFPGGKLEKGETPESALERELMEELGVTARCGRIYAAIPFDYPDRSVLLMFYAARIVSGEARAIDEAEIRWLGESELDTLDWAPADLRLVESLRRDGFPFVSRLCDN